MDNTCITINKNLSDYIDGKVSDDMSWKIGMHLVTCADCTKSLRQLRQTVSLLSQVQPRPLSSEFDIKLAAKIAAVNAQTRSYERSGAQKFWGKITVGFGSTRKDLKLKVGLAVAAMSLVFIGVVTPHLGEQASLHSGKTSTLTTPVVVQSIDGEDAAFMAACANDQSQSSDAQELVDPSAQSLAARFDSTSMTGIQATAVASPRQD